MRACQVASVVSDSFLPYGLCTLSMGFARQVDTGTCTEKPTSGPMRKSEINTKEKLVYSKAGVFNHWGRCITQ